MVIFNNEQSSCLQIPLPSQGKRLPYKYNTIANELNSVLVD